MPTHELAVVRFPARIHVTALKAGQVASNQSLLDGERGYYCRYRCSWNRNKMLTFGPKTFISQPKSRRIWRLPKTQR